MVLIEFKDAAFSKAFDELDYAKKSLKKSKLALCNVEESLCELYEAEKDNEDAYDEYDDENEIDDEIKYRRRRGMRMRMRDHRDSHDSMYMRRYGRYSY